MVAVSPSGKARQPVFREYFEMKVKEGKNKPQALVCVIYKPGKSLLVCK